LGLITQTSPIFMAVPVVMLSSLGIYKITQTAKIYTDAPARISCGMPCFPP
jgi:hypothetical protein